MNFQALILFLAILFILLDALDTYMIVHHGGREINRFGMRQMVQKMGLIPALLSSHGFLIVLLLYWRHILPTTAILVLLLVFILIFYHNMIGWIRAGHGT